MIFAFNFTWHITFFLNLLGKYFTFNLTRIYSKTEMSSTKKRPPLIRPVSRIVLIDSDQNVVEEAIPTNRKRRKKKIEEEPEDSRGSNLKFINLPSVVLQQDFGNPSQSSWSLEVLSQHSVQLNMNMPFIRYGYASNEHSALEA